VIRVTRLSILIVLHTEDAITMPPNASRIRGRKDNIVFRRIAGVSEIDLDAADAVS